MENKNKLQQAAFGMGCFWESEEVFRTVKGVKEAMVGFMGGTVENPSYEEVSMKDTGHAEVVHLTYDSGEVSYEEILRVFWEHHDPTTLNRQDPDVGSQYRSAIFFYNEDQKAKAEKAKAELEQSGKWKDPIVTEIVPAGEFYKAEEHHQRYLQKRGLKTCRA